MKRLLGSLAATVLLLGAMVGPASAAPNVVATIIGGGTSTMAEVFGIPNPGSSVFGFNVKLMSTGQRPGISTVSTSTATHRAFRGTSSAKSSAGRETSTARSR